MQHGELAGAPVQGVRVIARRRLVPHRRLLGDGVQDRRLDGVQERVRAGRSRAARADHGGRGDRSGRGRGRGQRRPQLAARPAAGDGAARRHDDDQGRGADGGDPHVLAVAHVADRRPRRLRDALRALRGGAGAHRAEGDRRQRRRSWRRPRRDRAASRRALACARDARALARGYLDVDHPRPSRRGDAAREAISRADRTSRRSRVGRPGRRPVRRPRTYPAALVRATSTTSRSRGVDRTGSSSTASDTRRTGIVVHADGVSILNMSAHNFRSTPSTGRTPTGSAPRT